MLTLFWILSHWAKHGYMYVMYIITYQGCIESHRDEKACNFPCFVLKHQNSYEFIHDLKNSNSIQEFTEVYWLKWCHSLLEHLLMKNSLTIEIQIAERKYITSPLKQSACCTRYELQDLSWLLMSINYSYLFSHFRVACPLVLMGLDTPLHIPDKPHVHVINQILW